MRWLELSCRVDREAVEPVSALFARHGRGVVIEDEGFIEGEERPDPQPFVFMRTYLALDNEAEARKGEIERGLWVLGLLRPIGELMTRELGEEDWAEAWKQHFHVHRVGKRTVIKPSWREYTPAPGEVVIELDPGMAFGTGLHPTTQLCLEALEDIVRPGQTVFDVGTGSGILAIAAAKLGAASVLAVDNDSVAVEVAQANVNASGLAAVVRVEHGSLPVEGGGTYDVVVANIIARVIIELAPALAAVTAPGGTLITSGILDVRADDVTAALRRAGLEVTSRRQRDDWVAIIARKQ